MVGGLKALAFFGMLAESCPQLLVATVVYSGLPHSVVQKCLQPSLSVHQPHRKVSGSNLFRQILIEYKLTVAVIAHHLGFILLDRSQLQVPPPVQRRELNEVKHQGWQATVHGVPTSLTRLSNWARTHKNTKRWSQRGSRLRVCWPQGAYTSAWAVLGFPGEQELPLWASTANDCSKVKNNNSECQTLKYGISFL